MTDYAIYSNYWNVRDAAVVPTSGKTEIFGGRTVRTNTPHRGRGPTRVVATIVAAGTIAAGVVAVANAVTDGPAADPGSVEITGGFTTAQNLVQESIEQALVEQNAASTAGD